MGLQPLDLLNVFAVCFQFRLFGIIALQSFRVDIKDFGICEGQLAGDRGINALQLLYHGLVGGIAHILVTETMGIAVGRR